MKKNTIKILLDILMSALLLLLYKKNVLTLAFHEIVGIGVCVLFIVHKILNIKWITSVGKQLFSKNIPARTKIGFVVDSLLFIDFLVILITGIGINKTISTTIAFLPQKAIPVHMFFGAVSVILIGIHIGLHWTWIKNVLFKKISQNKSTLLKVIGWIIFAALLVFGVYFLSKSSMGKWLTGLFNNSEAAHRHGGPGNGMGKMQGGPGMGGRGMSNITFKSVSTYIIQFLCIFFLFSGITALIDRVFKRKTPKIENKSDK